MLSKSACGELFRLAWCSFLIASLLSVALAQDNYYDFHPQSPMGLGVGYSPNDLTEDKLPCIKFTPVDVSGGNPGTAFSYFIVKDSTQLKTSMGLDLKVDASYLQYSGGVRFSYNTASLFASDSITMIISAHTEYPQQALKGDFSLYKFAQDLISAGNLVQFERSCGSKFVSKERRGASVSAIVTILDEAGDLKKTIDSELSGQGGWGAANATVKAAFTTGLERAHKSGTANIQVVATGGNGFDGLKKLVTDASGKADNLNAIQSALGEYMNQFNKDNAAKIGFFTQSMTVFGWHPDQNAQWTTAKERKLAELTETYRDVSRLRDEVKAYITDAGPVQAPEETQKVAALKNNLKEYNQYLDNLALAHANCKALGSSAGSCEVPTAGLPDEKQVLLRITKEPRVTFRYLYKNRLLDQDASVEPLSLVGPAFTHFSNHHGQLRELPGYGATQPILLIQGRFINKIVVSFKPSSGAEEVWDTYNFANMNAYRSIFRRWYGDIHVYDRLGDMAANKPAGSGTIYVTVSDNLGRTVKTKAADVGWKRNGAFDQAHCFLNSQAWTGDHFLKPI